MASGISGYGFNPRTALHGPMLETDIETDGSPSAPKSGPFNPLNGDPARIPPRCLDDASVGASERPAPERNGSFSADSRRVQKIERAADMLAEKIEAALRARRPANKTELSVSFRQSGDQGRTWISSSMPSITEDDCKTRSDFIHGAQKNVQANRNRQFQEKTKEAERSVKGLQNLLHQLTFNGQPVKHSNEDYDVIQWTFHKPDDLIRKPTFTIQFKNHEQATRFIENHNHKPMVVYRTGTCGVGVHANVKGNEYKETLFLQQTLSEILGVDLVKNPNADIGLNQLLSGLSTKFDEEELPAVGSTIALPLKAIQEPLDDGRRVPDMTLQELSQLHPVILQELKDRIAPSDTPWTIGDLPKVERRMREEQFRNLKI